MDTPRILITGASRGIGRAIAEDLAAAEHRVIVTGRHYATADATARDLPGDGHLALAFDVSDEHAWEEAMSEIDESGGLTGLVTTAAVLGPIGAIGDCSPSEFRRAIAVNLVGTALALHHAAPRLRRSGGAAVTFSGGGATRPLPRFDAYAASKAGVARLTENVAAAGVRANCVAPGFIATEIHRGTLAAGPAAVGAEYYERTKRELASGGSDIENVCGLVAFLLSDEAGGISGKLISAQWDPWRDEAFRDRLADEPDLATLRRIDDQAFTTDDPEPAVGR